MTHLDETISAGQAGHIADHQFLAQAVNDLEDAIHVADTSTASPSPWQWVTTNTADPLFAVTADTKVPTVAWVRAYVASGAAGGNVSTTDTSVAGWDWVTEESADPTYAVIADTKVPTVAWVRGYLDQFATLTTSDTAKVPIATTGGVTTLDVSLVMTTSNADFSDTTFTIHDSADSTRKIAFDASHVSASTTNTYTFPANGTVLVTQTGVQTLNYKTLAGVQLTNFVGTTAAGVGISYVGGEVNDMTRSNLVELHGHLLNPARIAFLQHGGAVGTPAQTAADVSVLDLVARGYSSGGAWAGGNSARIEGQTAEAITPTGRGGRLKFSVVPTGATTMTEAVRIGGTATAAPMVAMRGSLAIMAGSSMAEAASGYSLEVKADALGYGAGAGGAVTQITSKSTGVTLNKPCGQITMMADNLANGTNISFVLTNSYIAATDVVVTAINETNTAGGSYMTNVTEVKAGSCVITVRNYSGGALAEAVVINFAVVKAVAA